MYLSGRITNSFFAFLARCEFDTSRFFEMTELEIDSLKDPNSWMEASQVEALLYNIKKAYKDQFLDKDLVTTVGHNSMELNCWGGLEQFLKMFHNPDEIHNKLDIFFSYFVSPTLEINDKNKQGGYFSFTTNFNGEEHPTVRDYFCSLLEALPSFLGGSLTEVKWIDSEVKIYYAAEETLLLPLEEFQDSSRFLDGDILLQQIYSCEKNLLDLKKGGSLKLIDESLKIINKLKKSLGD
ncbi:MAG: hypothetical protein ACR2M7_00885 [Bdellovibrionales bacterium]